MPQAKLALQEDVTQVAGRILLAWKSGHGASLESALDHARRLSAHADRSSTFEMERLEALTGAVESIVQDGARNSAGAVRLLEHLAQK
jgi:hypothetical protein